MSGKMESSFENISHVKIGIINSLALIYVSVGYDDGCIDPNRQSIDFSLRENISPNVI